MVHEKFFISDTHFFHANMLRFTNDDGTRCRPFSSIEEMHEYIIEKWNSVVKDNDYVYHLGDVTFRYDGAFNNLMSRLKGKKRLTPGNHDKIWNPALQINFEKIQYWKGFKEGNFTACHIPTLTKPRDGNHWVHGHTHGRYIRDEQGNRIKNCHNVCVEVRDYTPVHIDTLIQEIKAAS